MDHSLRLAVYKDLTQCPLVANVGLKELDGADLPDSAEIVFLPRRRIEGIEVIDDRKRRSSTQQSFRQVGSDEAGSAGEEHALRVAGHSQCIHHEGILANGGALLSAATATQPEKFLRIPLEKQTNVQT
jgi:hypothetical protein